MHRARLKRPVQLFEKSVDQRVVTLEKYPLADAFRTHQPCFVKRGKVSRDRGLRHIAARVDLPCANPVLQRQFLFAKKCPGFVEPREYPAAHRIGQGLVNGVDIHWNSGKCGIE